MVYSQDGTLIGRLGTAAPKFGPRHEVLRRRADKTRKPAQVIDLAGITLDIVGPTVGRPGDDER